MVFRLLFMVTVCAVFTANAFTGTSGSDCRDKDTNCDQTVCRDYPFTAKLRCAKTCGHCVDSLSQHSGHSRTSSASSTSSRHSSAGSESGTCADKDADCTQKICTDRPYTAKQRCAKTCGICALNERTGRHRAHIHDRDEYDNARGSTRDQHPADATRGKCADKERGCTEQSCLDHPYTARTKCAKTCGFCSDDSTSRITLISPSDDRTSSSGSRIGLRPDSELGDRRQPSSSTSDHSRKTSDSRSHHGSTTSKHITDNIRHGSTSSKHSSDTDRFGSRHSSVGEGSDKSVGSSRSSSRHSSISERRGSVFDRKGSDMDRAFGSIGTTHFTTPSTSGRHTGRLGKVRYAGREGLCRDDNRHCEKDDCTNFPYFSQRFCEKTCNYC